MGKSGKSGRAGQDRVGRGPRAARPPRTPRYAPVTLSEENGIRYLHFGTEWIQGAMVLRQPDALFLDYARHMMAFMLFLPQPTHIAQLGLGSAALTKFCYRSWPEARITAVELNPEVIAVARTMFRLPPDDARLAVLQMDALDYVNDASHHGRHDVLQIDLYDAQARGPVLDTVEFYRSARACLHRHGMLTVNLFGDHASFPRNMQALVEAFEGRVLALPEVHQGNRIALAFNAPVDVAFADLYDRADRIDAAVAMQARSWVDGLRAVARERLVDGRFVITP